MKTLLTVAVLFFQACSVMAGSCRPLEYAELKDSSSEKLVRIYCEYVKRTSHGEEVARVENELLQKITSGAIAARTEKEHEKTLNSIYQCIDERSKISSALENRKEPAEPRCETQKSSSSR